MRETLLAFLALSIVTTMSIGIMSATLQKSIKQVDREIEVYASAVAAHVMDYVSSRSFDQRTTPNSWINLGEPLTAGGRPDSTQYTLASNFGQPVGMCNLFEPWTDTVICDDISDVHMDSLWQPYQYVVEVNGADTLAIPFDVNVQVSYVDPDAPLTPLPPSARTTTKRVVVTVRSVQHHLDNMAGGVAIIERLMSFDRDAAIAHSTASVEVCYLSNTLNVNSLLVPIYEDLGGLAGPCP